MAEIDLGIEIMRAAGIDDGKIKKLISLRREILEGKRSEIDTGYKRLVFIRKLYDRGRINDDEQGVNFISPHRVAISPFVFSR